MIEMVENASSEENEVGIGEINKDFQVSIPPEVRKKLKLKIGDCIIFVEKYGEMVISKVLEMSQLDDLIQDLVTIALQDGKITEEEKKLIKSIYANIATFKKVYRKAWKDDMITPEEKNLLTHLWKRIYDKTAESVQKEKKITLDEMKLLMSVFRTIHHPEL
jgi:bifunctional DNA-binding transcriptional regulator/antitoxin component of YhaV-PrlF toxin-antitoxin module